MTRILRGEVRWAELNPVRGHEQAGQRPVLILSHDIFNRRSGTVIAMTITSQPQKAGFPLTYSLDSKQLQKASWVKTSQIRTLSVQRIEKIVGTVEPEQLGEIIDGFNQIVGGDRAQRPGPRTKRRTHWLALVTHVYQNRTSLSLYVLRK